MGPVYTRMVRDTDGTSESTPLLKRLFGGGAKHRTAELVRQRTNEVSYEAIESDERREGLRHVLKELDASDERTWKYVTLGIFAVVNHIVGGIISMMFLEGWSLHDAAYFCVVTTTTVGYGDLSPTTPLAKAFVIYYVIASIAIISSYLAYFVGLLIDQQEELLLSRVVEEREAIRNAANAGNSSSRILAATEGLDLSDYANMGFSLAFLFAVLLCGFLVFRVLEGLSTLDSIYATVISATTVGFGDLRPTHPNTKISMTVWLVISTISVAKVLADFTDATVKVKQRGVTRRLLTAQMDHHSWQMFDKDKDGAVEWGEFLSAMLISCGKIDKDELEAFRLRFNELDKDDSGRLERSEATG